MPKNKVIVILGAFVAILHIVNGLPNNWEAFLSIIAGLSIVLISFLSSWDKRMSLRAKAQKRQQTRKLTEDMQSDEETEVPVARGRRVTDRYPVTGQPGRRVSDIPWNDINGPIV